MTAARRPQHRVEKLDAKDPVVTSGVEAIAAESFPGTPFSLAEELARPWARMWTAFDGETLTGFLIAWHVADELHVLNVATAGAHRRRGVGTALMEVGLAYARSVHARILLLEVRRSNRPAIKLYRSLGFTVLGVRPRYYADNDEDAVEMILALDPESGKLLASRDEMHIES